MIQGLSQIQGHPACPIVAEVCHACQHSHLPDFNEDLGAGPFDSFLDPQMMNFLPGAHDFVMNHPIFQSGTWDDLGRQGK